MNTLQLKQIDGASQVKSGDFGSRFAFQLLDDRGKLMEELNEKTASIRLTNAVGFTYEKEVEIQDGEVAFKFDKVLPSGTYWIEIWVEDYIFPSDRETKLKLVKASKDREMTGNSQGLAPVRDMLGRPVDKVKLHKVNGSFPSYPNIVRVVLDTNNTAPSYISSRNWTCQKNDELEYSLLTIQTNDSDLEEVDSIYFEVNGQSYTIAVEVVSHPFPSPPILDISEVLLNAENDYEAKISVSNLSSTTTAWSIYNQNFQTAQAYLSEHELVIKSWSPPEQSFDTELIIRFADEHYIHEVPMAVHVEVM